MADYYPLLSRALDALSDTSVDTRRSVYDRARNALAGQLGSLDPPLSEAEIARERRALEEAIDRIEAEQADSGRVADAPPAPPSVPPRRSPGGSPDPPRPSAEVQDQIAHPEPERPLPIRVRESRRGSRAPPEARDARAEDEVQSGSSGRERPRIETVRPGLVGDAARRRSIILGAVLLILVGAIAVSAWLLRDQPSELAPPSGTEATAPGVESQGKLADRVGGERPPAGTSASAGGGLVSPSTTGAPASGRADVPVAQRAVLFEENTSDPQNPKSSTGRVLWRLDAVNGGQGQPLETVIRGTVEVPDAGMTLNLTIRRNLDATLPASHTIELAFTVAAEPNRTVRDVGLIQLKPEEAVRGTPVSGLPVPVKDNLFLIGLSNLKGDVERNTDLLLNRSWIDLPLRFSTGQRAVLSLEKGISGERVFSDAFAQWR